MKTVEIAQHSLIPRGADRNPTFFYPGLGSCKNQPFRSLNCTQDTNPSTRDKTVRQYKSPDRNRKILRDRNPEESRWMLPDRQRSSQLKRSLMGKKFPLHKNILKPIVIMVVQPCECNQKNPIVKLFVHCIMWITTQESYSKRKPGIICICF